MLENSVSVPLNRYMPGATMTTASRAMAQPRSIGNPPLCKAQKARRSPGWLVGLRTVWHGQLLMWQRLLSMNPSSSRLQETLQVLPIQVPWICILHEILLYGTAATQIECLRVPPGQQLQDHTNCILNHGHRVIMAHSVVISACWNEDFRWKYDADSCAGFRLSLAMPAIRENIIMTT